MAAASDADFPTAIPTSGMGPESHDNVLRDAMRKHKREWLDAKMGKGESWTRKVLNDEAGVTLDDIPLLITLCGFKLAPLNKAVLDLDIARAYEVLARHTLKTRTLVEE